MGNLVTIAIPVYKRLGYLPGVLQAVAAQDYPDIELIVSDNGQNGAKVSEIVDRHYARPYRLRQNAVTVNIPSHYHQVLSEATGDYFVWLQDDDLVSPAFASKLVGMFERFPNVSVAIASQEIIDSSGHVMRRSSADVPDYLSGDDFIRAWTAYKFENYSTVLARTRDIRECGGFADFPTGTHSDNALLIKLCLRGGVAVSRDCTFQYRWHDTSHGWSLDWRTLANDMNLFFKFLESDPIICAYRSKNPASWSGMRDVLFRMNWTTYLDRWKTLYRQRLDFAEWMRMAFALPFIPDYYSEVGSILTESLKTFIKGRRKMRLP